MAGHFGESFDDIETPTGVDNRRTRCMLNLRGGGYPRRTDGGNAMLLRQDCSDYLRSAGRLSGAGLHPTARRGDQPAHGGD